MVKTMRRKSNFTSITSLLSKPANGCTIKKSQLIVTMSFSFVRLQALTLSSIAIFSRWMFGSACVVMATLAQSRVCTRVVCAKRINVSTIIVTKSTPILQVLCIVLLTIISRPSKFLLKMNLILGLILSKSYIWTRITNRFIIICLKTSRLCIYLLSLATNNSLI